MSPVDNVENSVIVFADLEKGGATRGGAARKDSFNQNCAMLKNSIFALFNTITERSDAEASFHASCNTLKTSIVTRFNTFTERLDTWRQQVGGSYELSKKVSVVVGLTVCGLTLDSGFFAPALGLMAAATTYAVTDVYRERQKSVLALEIIALQNQKIQQTESKLTQANSLYREANSMSREAEVAVAAMLKDAQQREAKLEELEYASQAIPVLIQKLQDLNCLCDNTFRDNYELTRRCIEHVDQNLDLSARLIENNKQLVQAKEQLSVLPRLKEIIGLKLEISDLREQISTLESKIKECNRKIDFLDEQILLGKPVLIPKQREYKIEKSNHETEITRLRGIISELKDKLSLVTSLESNEPASAPMQSMSSNGADQLIDPAPSDQSASRGDSPSALK